jgi:apolipoprotein N-acyltransferase
VHGFALDVSLQAAIADLARQAQAPLLFGSADFGKYAEEAGLAAEDVQFKNQAFLVQPDGSTQGPYTKNRLVPFAETVPLAGRVTWPRWLVARLRHGIAGDAPGLFRLPEGSGRSETVVGTLICWENLFGDLSARLARERASVIVQLTNDTDFRGRAEPLQHGVASILRAVECGRPVVVASTGGPSFGVDAYGRTSPPLMGPRAVRELTIASVNTEDGTTVYSRCGLLWLWVISIVAAAAGVLGIATRRRERA